MKVCSIHGAIRGPVSVSLTGVVPSVVAHIAQIETNEGSLLRLPAGSTPELYRSPTRSIDSRVLVQILEAVGSMKNRLVVYTPNDQLISPTGGDGAALGRDDDNVHRRALGL